MANTIPHSHSDDNTKLNMFSDLTICRKGRLRGDGGIEGILKFDLDEYKKYITSIDPLDVFKADGLKISIARNIANNINQSELEINGTNIRIFNIDSTWGYNRATGLYKISQF
jgi:hypothetical protein